MIRFCEYLKARLSIIRAIVSSSCCFGGTDLTNLAIKLKLLYSVKSTLNKKGLSFLNSLIRRYLYALNVVQWGTPDFTVLQP